MILNLLSSRTDGQSDDFPVGARRRNLIFEATCFQLKRRRYSHGLGLMTVFDNQSPIMYGHHSSPLYARHKREQFLLNMLSGGFKYSKCVNQLG
jgi:hypothetical protein